MIQRIIKKDDFKQLVDAMLKDNKKVYGPIYDEDSVVIAELNPTTEIVFDRSMSVLPGKRLFFPQKELMFTYKDNQPQQVELPEENFIVFGLRPCDTLALTYLDKVFAAEDCIDPYYTTRRYNSLIISFACTTMAQTCFCTSVNGSPVGTDGSDIIVNDLGTRLFFTPISETGNDFINSYSEFFIEPTHDDVKKKEDIIFRLKNEQLNSDRNRAIEQVKACSNTDEVWESLSERCLGCGVCTYVCPTCHCFVLREETINQENNRIRVNDSCMFPSFTSEASGHNPRQMKRTRIRQRIMHKFNYSVKNFDDVFCVGCGRCITNCPANVDIREIVLKREDIHAM